MLTCKPHNAFTVAQLASPLHLEDLPSIVRRPKSVMGILQKVDERGDVPSMYCKLCIRSYNISNRTPSLLVVDLQFQLKGG